MTIDFPKFRKLLCHLRELLSGPCRIDYINGSDTFPRRCPRRRNRKCSPSCMPAAPKPAKH